MSIYILLCIQYKCTFICIFVYGTDVFHDDEGVLVYFSFTFISRTLDRESSPPSHNIILHTHTHTCMNKYVRIQTGEQNTVFGRFRLLTCFIFFEFRSCYTTTMIIFL